MEIPDFSAVNTDSETAIQARVAAYVHDIMVDLVTGISYTQIIDGYGGFDELERLVGSEYANYLKDQAGKEEK